MKFGTFVLLATLLGAAVNGAHAGSPVAWTEQGQVSGQTGHGVQSFLGLPYAAPPTGSLRWAAPVPAPHWEGTRDGTRYGPQCMQKPSAGDAGVGEQPFSEDCLYLNVWTPGVGARNQAPVMVWIHGGGFTTGSGSAPLYDGAAFARRGIVLVTINYRLGNFGFFAHPALNKEGEPGPNYALLDQIAVLKWVKANIASFGGDPDNVTIFGESAGGWAVNRLMLAPPARALFARAIVQSGLGREAPRSLDAAERDGEALAAKMGYPSATPADLRSIPPEAIRDATPSIYAGFGPIADQRLVEPGSVLDGFRAGSQAKVPYIVGFNSLEFPGALVAKSAEISALLPVLKADDRRLALAAYGDEARLKRDLASDYLFVEPALALAAAHAATGAPTHVYRFDGAPLAIRTSVGGAYHASERAFVFGNPDRAPWRATPAAIQLADRMNRTWSDFAKGKTPLSDWPRFAPDGSVLEWAEAGDRIVPASSLAGPAFVELLRGQP